MVNGFLNNLVELENEMKNIEEKIKTIDEKMIENQEHCDHSVILLLDEMVTHFGYDRYTLSHDECLFCKKANILRGERPKSSRVIDLVDFKKDQFNFKSSAKAAFIRNLYYDYSLMNNDMNNDELLFNFMIRLEDMENEYKKEVEEQKVLVK